jgi:hypothetical protein
MTETIEAKTPIDVKPTATDQQIKAQVRLILAALAGAMVGKHILPRELANDVVLDAVSALIMIGLASAWQWARVKLQHSRLWKLATNPRVPDDLVRPVTTQGEAP